MTFCLLEFILKMSNNFDVNQNLTFFVAKKQAHLSLGWSSLRNTKSTCVFPNKQSHVIHRIFLILQDRSIHVCATPCNNTRHIKILP